MKSTRPLKAPWTTSKYQGSFLFVTLLSILQFQEHNCIFNVVGYNVQITWRTLWGWGEKWQRLNLVSKDQLKIVFFPSLKIAKKCLCHLLQICLKYYLSRNCQTAPPLTLNFGLKEPDFTKYHSCLHLRLWSNFYWEPIAFEAHTEAILFL